MLLIVFILNISITYRKAKIKSREEKILSEKIFKNMEIITNICYNNKACCNFTSRKEKLMILIIAEKPSLARNIVAGIGKMDK